MRGSRWLLVWVALVLLGAGLLGGLPGAGAASDEVVWTLQFGSSGPDAVRGIAAVGSGVYVSGWTEGALPGQTALGALDAYVMKFDHGGNPLWARQFGTVEWDFGLGVAADASGVYVVGSTIGALPNHRNYGFFDVFLRKYDPDGRTLWTRQIGSAGNDWGLGIALRQSGVYIVGGTNGGFLGHAQLGQEDAFIVKYSPEGALLWSDQFGTGEGDRVWAVAADASGVYLTGATSGALPGQANYGGQDAFVRKYRPGGTLVWTRQFGTNFSTNGDEGSGVAVDASGVYVTGWTEGALAGQTHHGQRDVFVRKYDPEGVYQWTREFGTQANDWGSGVAVDASGVYVTGHVEGALPQQNAFGGADAFLRWYDPAGTLLRTRQFGTSGADDASGAALWRSRVYVAGGTDGVLPEQTQLGLTDIFLRKYRFEE